MKLLATAIFAGFMAVGTSACAKEEPKKEAAVAAAPAAAPSAPAAAAPAAPAPEYKTVCLDVQGKDGKPVLGKDGKPRQNCTKVRVRQKFEGTKIEDAKKQ
jgi:azurin